MKPKSEAAALQTTGNGPAGAFALVKADCKKMAEALFKDTTTLALNPPFKWS
jgi:hypothetical protein